MLWFTAQRRAELLPKGGGEMEILDPISVPACIYAVGHIVLRLLPLVSDRVNKRAVRLAKAKRK